MIPVIVLRNKVNQDRYLANSLEVCDRNGEVAIDNIKNAYMIVRKDLTPPNHEDFETEKQFHAEHKANMIRLYGDNAFISLDFEGVCEAYEPVNIEITQEQYEYAKSLWEE